MKTWIKNLNFVLIAAVTCFAANSFAATAKKNVCAMTINSNDEINLFKKHLSPEQFNFIELTEKGSKKDWLQASCKENITCDVLVISGHFGGSFFGATGLRLPLEELEAASCDSACSGILHKPKEVFLFGCNTLAGKEKDARTPEQYIHVLVEDGFSRDQAEQIAAFRYSPMGSSFNDRMSRIFSKVPRIYGFSSIAPSGKTIAPHLGGYLKENSATYFDKLTTLASEPNTSLANRLKGQPFVQTKGAESVTSPVCYIENPKTSTIAKLKYTLEVLDTGGVLELAPYLSRYFKNLDEKILNPAERRLLHQVHSHSDAREKLETFIAKPIPGLLKPQVNTLNLMLNINWITEKKYNQYLADWVLGPLYKSTTLNQGTVDRFCSLEIEVPSVDPKKIHPALWDGDLLYQALGCLKSKNAELLNVIAQQLENPLKIKPILYYIAASRAASNEVRIALEKIYEKGGKTSYLSYEIRDAILISGHQDTNFILSKFETFLQDPRNAEFKQFGAITNDKLSPHLAQSIINEVFNPRSAEALEAVLSMSFNSQPSAEMNLRLLEIIKGKFPVTTQIPALVSLEIQNYANPQRLFLMQDILRSKTNYQMKRQVLNRVLTSSGSDNVTRLREAITEDSEPFLRKTLELKALALARSWEQTPYYSAFNHHLYLADMSSPLIQKINSGEIAYLRSESPLADNKGTLYSVIVTIGIGNRSAINNFLNYENNLGIYNPQTKSIIGLYPIEYDSEMAPDSKQFGNFYFTKVSMNQARLVVTALTNDSTTGDLRQDYSAALLQAQKDLIEQLKTQNPESKKIIMGQSSAEVSIELLDANSLKMTLNAKGVGGKLQATSVVKLIPGANKVGSVAIEDLKVTTAPPK